MRRGQMEQHAAGLIGTEQPLSELYDVLLLDLDGVVYIGPDAVPGAAEALVCARKAGLGARVVINNAFRPAPVAVVQGFGPDVGCRLLAEGTRGVRAGLPWIATTTDLPVPTAFGPAPGNGTLVAAIRAATKVEPEVAGKPQPPLFLDAVRRS